MASMELTGLSISQSTSSTSSTLESALSILNELSRGSSSLDHIFPKASKEFVNSTNGLIKSNNDSSDDLRNSYSKQKNYDIIRNIYLLYNSDVICETLCQFLPYSEVSIFYNVLSNACDGSAGGNMKNTLHSLKISELVTCIATMRDLEAKLKRLNEKKLRLELFGGRDSRSTDRLKYDMLALQLEYVNEARTMYIISPNNVKVLNIYKAKRHELHQAYMRHAESLILESKDKYNQLLNMRADIGTEIIESFEACTINNNAVAIATTTGDTECVTPTCKSTANTDKNVFNQMVAKIISETEVTSNTQSDYSTESISHNAAAKTASTAINSIVESSSNVAAIASDCSDNFGISESIASFRVSMLDSFERCMNMSIAHINSNVIDVAPK